MLNKFHHISFIRFLLPKEIEIPEYMLAKKRQIQIWNTVFNAVENGNAIFLGSGTEKPSLSIRRVNNDKYNINLFTDIVLRLHTENELVFRRDINEQLIFFINQFKSAERIYTHSDTSSPNSPQTETRQIILNAYEKFDLTKIMPTVPPRNR